MPHPLDTSRTAPHTRLAAGQARVVNASEGALLTVLQGRLWVTLPGCTEDLFLHAGEQLHLHLPGVLVQADGPLGQASYRLQADSTTRPPAPQRPAWTALLRRLRVRVASPVGHVTN